MFRKKLTPSSLRRCAVFLAVGGALALNSGRAQGGVALEGSSDDQASLVSPDLISGSQLPFKVSVQNHASDDSTPKQHSQVSPVSSPDALTGPGLTGENWFQGLQQGIDQGPDDQEQAAPAVANPKKPLSALDNSVKANAIPSLPSFWSGLTCCLALVVAGMFPRVRRVLR